MFKVNEVCRMFFCLGVMAGGVFEAYAMTVVAPDQTPATIVIPVKAGRPLSFAAKELQEYIIQITDVRLDIKHDGASVRGPRILLSCADAPNRQVRTLLPNLDLPAANSDEFLLRIIGGALVIAGGGERAVLYGVYDFLEQVGCRWFGPGEEHVPRKDTIAITELNISEKPFFDFRALELHNGSPAEIIDWMAKVKLNTVWPGFYIPNDDMTVSEADMQRCSIPQMIERGFTIIWGGHVIPFLLPPDKYGEEHPEYFALINGKRLDPDILSSTDDPEKLRVFAAVRHQPCTSNAEAVCVLTENTIKFLKNHEWVDIFRLSANDAVKWCECESCVALEPAPDKKAAFYDTPDRSATYARLTKILNEGSLPGMAPAFDGIQDVLPDRQILYSHYYNMEAIPTDIEGNVMEEVLADPTGVISVWIHYGQENRHAFADPGCPKSKRIESIAKMWKPYYKNALGRTYYFSWNFIQGLPVSMFRKIPDDFRFFKSLGAMGSIDCTTLKPLTMHWRNNQMNFDIYARAMWDANLDVDSVIGDYIQHYYGPASAPMARAWKLIEESWTKYLLHPKFMPEDDVLNKPELAHVKTTNLVVKLHPESWGKLIDGNQFMDIRYLIPNRRVYEEMMGYLRQAERAASNSPESEYAYRVQLLKNVILTFDADKWDYEIFGMYNYGGFRTEHIYSLGDEVKCTVAYGGNNKGDCFWPKPLGTKQFSEVGDSVQVDVRVNTPVTKDFGSYYNQLNPMRREAFGRSRALGPIQTRSLCPGGPGLYQAESQTTKCGVDGTHSAQFFIGDLIDRNTGPNRVIATFHDGGFQTSTKSSRDRVWDFAEYVTLRIKFMAKAPGKYTYRYSYRSAAEWVQLCTFTSQVELPCVAPYFHYTESPATNVDYRHCGLGEFQRFFVS